MKHITLSMGKDELTRILMSRVALMSKINITEHPFFGSYHTQPVVFLFSFGHLN